MITRTITFTWVLFLLSNQLRAQKALTKEEIAFTIDWINEKLSQLYVLPE